MEACYCLIWIAAWTRRSIFSQNPLSFLHRVANQILIRHKRDSRNRTGIQADARDSDEWL